MVRLTFSFLLLFLLGCEFPCHNAEFRINLVRIEVQNPIRQSSDGRPGIVLGFILINKSSTKLKININPMYSEGVLENFILFADNRVAQYEKLKLFDYSIENKVQTSQIVPANDHIVVGSQERLYLKYFLEPTLNVHIKPDSITETSYKKAYYDKVTDLFSNEIFIHLIVNQKSYSLKQYVDEKMINYE